MRVVVAGRRGIGLMMTAENGMTRTVRGKVVTAACVATAIGCAWVAGAGGCSKPPAPPPPPAPVAHWHPPTGRRAQAMELSRRTRALDGRIDAMAAAPDAASNASTAEALGELSKCLALLRGSDEPPRYANFLSTIDGARGVLGSDNVTASRAATAQNDALRAAISAMDDLTAGPFAADPKLPTVLDKLDAARSKVATVMSENGAMHDADAPSAFRAVATVVRTMGDDLSTELPPKATTERVVMGMD